MPGFALGDEAKPPPRGVSIGESEINLQANVDQALFANLTVAFENDNSVNVEEAFIQPTALPWGFTAKVGRFFSGIGYLNEQHSHIWDFADRRCPIWPSSTGNMTMTACSCAGSRRRNMFLEFGGEAMRGDVLPGEQRQRGADEQSQCRPRRVERLRPCRRRYRRQSSYSAGLSYLGTRSSNRATDPVGGPAGSDSSPAPTTPTSPTRVYKWAPNGNFAQSYVKLQGEVFLRQEAGRLHRARLRGPPGTATALFARIADRLLCAGGVSVHAALARRRAL